MKYYSLILIPIVLLITSCSRNPNQTDIPADSRSTTQLTASITSAVTITPKPTSSPIPLPPTATEQSSSSNEAMDILPTQTPATNDKPPQPTLNPRNWQNFPVIPVVSDNVLKIYQRGLEMGNNPHSFSKIGDCGGTPAWFLGDFDRGPKFYRLGDYTYLEDVIQNFQGSFGRTSLAAKSGFNASSIFTTLWSDPEKCQKDETPIACEYRDNRPIMAIIALGTNDVYHPEQFEPQMRKIIEYSIAHGVIPILATKADNLEGDYSINETIARLAIEYDIPLWNYWRAVQPLPNHGLQEDGAHLTWARNFFDDHYAMESGWTIRNLTALQALDAVWQVINQNQ